MVRYAHVQRAIYAQGPEGARRSVSVSPALVETDSEELRSPCPVCGGARSWHAIRSVAFPPYPLRIVLAATASHPYQVVTWVLGGSTGEAVKRASRGELCLWLHCQGCRHGACIKSLGGTAASVVPNWEGGPGPKNQNPILKSNNKRQRRRATRDVD